MATRFQPQRPFIIPVFLPHAGCPHQCVFCNQHVIAGNPDTSATPGDITGIIRQYARFRGRRRSGSQIAFYGGNFLGLPPKTVNWLLETADRQIKAGLADSIRFSTRPDTVDERRMDMLTPFAVDTIELGVQSMDDRVLSRSRRGHLAHDTVAAVDQLRRRGYQIGIQLMIGLPAQTAASLKETAYRVASLSPGFVRIYPTLVLKHSDLANWYNAGRYAPLSLHRAVDQAKDLYLFFSARGIAVVRMGLQASEGLDSGTMIVAGPYHPAFGHLVHCRLFFVLARRLLKSMPALPKTVTLKVHPRSVSRLLGPKRAHIDALKNELGLGSLEIVLESGQRTDAVSLAESSASVSYSDLAADIWNPVESNQKGDEVRCDCD